MSTPCTTCGQPLPAADDRCPTCGALASPAVDETVSLAATDGTTADDAPPWSIPIREPRAVAPTEDRSGHRRSAALALLAGAVLVAMLAFGAQALGGDDDDAGTASGDTAQPDPDEVDESGGIDVDAFRAETTTSTTPATAAPTTTETTPPSSTAPAPTTTVPPSPTTTAFAARTGPNGTGSVPALSTGFRGWLAQLTSVPYDVGTDALAEEWQRLRDGVPGAVAARSDDWAAFRDGFWVLVDPGPFSSADDVRSFCASAGFAGDGECLPRELRG